MEANLDTPKEIAPSNSNQSIELCSIHYTKGLEYPMVILVDSAKSLTTQTSSESFKITELDNKIVVGFKIDEETPLAYRVASKISLLKHIEEKKRILYVALTRAKNHLIISKNLKESQQIPKNSYLEWLEPFLKNDLKVSK